MYTVRGWPEVGVVGLGVGRGVGGWGGGDNVPSGHEKQHPPTPLLHQPRKHEGWSSSSEQRHHHTTTQALLTTLLDIPSYGTDLHSPQFIFSKRPLSIRTETKRKGTKDRMITSAWTFQNRTVPALHFGDEDSAFPSGPVDGWQGWSETENDGTPRIQWPVFSQANGQGVGLSHDVWAVSEYTVLYKVLVRDFSSLSLFFFFARVSLEVHTVSVSRRLILVGIFLCSFSSFTLGRVGFSLCRSLFMEKSMDKSEELKNKQQQNKTKQTNKNLPAPQTPLRCPHR